MEVFKNPQDSHAHSLKILSYLREYDTFLESLQVIADMGCGSGLDSEWWVNLETRDEDPEPLNYMVYSVDRNIKQIEADVLKNDRIVPIEGNFEDRIIPRQVDLIWAHDVLQYTNKPLECLSTWKRTLNTNGMLFLSVRQTTYMENNRLRVMSHDNQYNNYNLLNLMYLLATAGFDCRDAFFLRESNSPWLYAAVYASGHEPMESASWEELIEKQLINDSVAQSINKYGYARLEDVIVSWFDRENYFVKD
jgi:SAM-dependent methyltransferase